MRIKVVITEKKKKKKGKVDKINKGKIHFLVSKIATPNQD